MQTLKRLCWQARGIWITAPSIALIVIVLRLMGVWQGWEWFAFDQYMRWRPQPLPEKRIAIVGINELDIQRLQQPVISDQVYARLLRKLSAMQPRAIGLDIYRDLPVEPGHSDLLQVFNSTPNLVGIQKVLGQKDIETVAPPPVLKKLGQVGANDFILDADKRVRRGFIYMVDPAATGKSKTVFSFGLHLALHYLEADEIRPQPLKGTQVRWRLGKSLFRPFEANDGGYIGADAGGFQILLDYRGSRQSFETVSLTEVLEDRMHPDWGQDRIILIGKIGESFKDTYFTPHSSGLRELPEPMPGVEIHAHITSQIISAALGERPLFRSWSEPLDWLWILLWSIVGATLAWQLRYRKGVQTLSFYQSVSLFLAGGLLFGTTYFAFLFGWWVPMVPPFTALIGSAIAITAYIARTASLIRQTFGRYLSDEVVAHVLENPRGLQLGGQRRQITMLASDLRGFTALAERISPEDVVKVLNLYLKHMADVILQYRGTIDDYLGDGIAVLFGAPESYEDDASRAVSCAIAMQLAMAEVNAKITTWGFSELEMGIGINTGEVVLGNIGSERRTKYSAIGSAMNLAFRIESYTVGGQIYISESTLAAVGEHVLEVTDRQVVHPKGIQKPVTLYQVGGIKGARPLMLYPEELCFLPLPESILLRYTVLDGKQVQGAIFRGQLVELSARGAKIQCDVRDCPSHLTNVRLNFCTVPDSVWRQEGDDTGIYAKVMRSCDEGFDVVFTTIPPLIDVQLRTLYTLMLTINREKNRTASATL